jgi:hypothetical protein
MRRRSSRQKQSSHRHVERDGVNAAPQLQHRSAIAMLVN